MTVIEKRRLAGDRAVISSLTPKEAVKALFADAERFLSYYKTLSVPQCRVRKVVRKHESWEIPDSTCFPVAGYDKRGVLMVADTKAKLVSFLEEHQDEKTALLFEVGPGARFVWINFEKGQDPRVIDQNQPCVGKIDWSVINRLEHINRLFFNDGVTHFRLQFAVDSDCHFKLMCGVIKGY